MAICSPVVVGNVRVRLVRVRARGVIVVLGPIFQMVSTGPPRVAPRLLKSWRDSPCVVFGSLSDGCSTILPQISLNLIWVDPPFEFIEFILNLNERLLNALLTLIASWWWSYLVKINNLLSASLLLLKSVILNKVILILKNKASCVFIRILFNRIFLEIFVIWSVIKLNLHKVCVVFLIFIIWLEVLLSLALRVH